MIPFRIPVTRAIRQLPLLAAAGFLLLLAGCASLDINPVSQTTLHEPVAGQPHVHIVSLGMGAPVYNPLYSDYDGVCLNLHDPACVAALPQNRQYAVDVHVTDTSAPVILGLSGFYRIQWRLHLAPGVQLRRVVLTGYYPQTVTGVPGGVEVETRLFGNSFCLSCFRGHNYFYNIRKPAPVFADLIDQPATTFQGRFETGTVTVSAPR